MLGIGLGKHFLLPCLFYTFTSLALSWSWAYLNESIWASKIQTSVYRKGDRITKNISWNLSVQFACVQTNCEFYAAHEEAIYRTISKTSGPEAELFYYVYLSVLRSGAIKVSILTLFSWAMRAGELVVSGASLGAHFPGIRGELWPFWPSSFPVCGPLQRGH